MNICVVLPNWIGDVVMATPALRAIHQRFAGQAKIMGVMRPYVAKVLEGTNWLDEQIFFDGKRRGASLKIWTQARQLRTRDIDKCILMPNSISSGLLAWLGGAHERVGFVRYGRGPLLTHKLYEPRAAGRITPRSAVEHYVELAEAAGCPVASRQLELATTPADEHAADLVWRNHRWRPGQTVVALNTGSANSPARHWPAEYNAQLARRMASELDVSVLVLCGPAERAQAAHISRLAGHTCVKSMADQDLGLGASKACLRRCSLMVTSDSGPRHIAKAFGVPLVSMFGPIDPRLTATPHPPEDELYLGLDCQPCGKTVCPLKHHRCMRDLSVDQVFAAAARRLETSAAKMAA